MTVVPRGPLTPEMYLRDRVEDQEAWYRRKAAQHDRSRLTLAALVFVANAVAAVLAYLNFDAWVSVITTLVGVLTTYSALTAADFLASSYARTAGQLRGLSRAWRDGLFAGDPAGFARFVQQVEQVIAREHSGWNAVLQHVSKRDS